MTKEFKVIDYPMGTGKTRYIKDYMLDNLHKRYIYVTPLLSEAEKMASVLAALDMQSPDNEDGTKSEDFLLLLQEGSNISTTHSLFRSLRSQHLGLIKHWKYTVIIDETVDFIESYNEYSKDDIKDLLDRGDLTVDETNNGKVSMNWDVSEGNTYANLKGMCDAGLIYSTKLPAMMLNVQVPPKMLEEAEEVIVMTYLYESSFMHKFMQLHGFSYKKLSIPELDAELPSVRYKIKNNLKIVEVKALNALLGNQRETALSHSWWDTKLKKETQFVKSIFKTCSNWLINNQEHKESFFFTCPKVVVQKSSAGQRQTKALLEKSGIQYFSNPLGEKEKEEIRDGSDKVVLTKTVNVKWLYSGTKATNDYADKTMCFYLINAYPNVGVAHYLRDFGTQMDNDEFALSEMIQFLWRGNIRVKDGEMQVYVGSSRMKKLLLQWIEGV